LDCSWTGEDVLIVGGFFVEIDSYAIALSFMQVGGWVTRWGLFLMRGDHFFSESIAYCKAGIAADDYDGTLWVFAGRSVLVHGF